MSENRTDVIHTRIWREDPEPNNPFVAQTAYCCGYDVYGQMLGKARWVEMLYLLFKYERPSPQQADLLETLAVALANPGPRDASVHAAMCGGVCGSTAASSLMAALAVGAGQYAGGREVYIALQHWQQFGLQLDAWQQGLCQQPEQAGSIWPKQEHPAGFEPHGVSTSTIVKQTLSLLASYQPDGCLAWLQQHYLALERVASCPLSLSGVAAAAFADLGFSPEQGEMLYLLLRLPGAAAHALEQTEWGYKNFPFGTVELQQEVAP